MAQRLGWRFIMAAGLATAALAAPRVAPGEHEPAWLDESYGPRALAWVKGETTRTLSILRQDPRFTALEHDAAAVLTEPSTLEDITISGPLVYQYHQTREAPLGVWRRTPIATYARGRPEWETVIDLDALSAAERHKYFFAGAACRKQRCLVRLSINGRDAATTREFDLQTRRFVPNGFSIADGKSRAWWYDDDTLLVAPVMDRASVNSSLVPKTLRLWRRGTPLTATRPLFSVEDHDAGLGAQLIRAGDTDRFVAARSINREDRQYSLISADGRSQPLALPSYAQTMGMYLGKLLIRLDLPWTPSGATTALPAGSLLAVPVEPLMKEGRVAPPELLYQPSGDDALRGVTVVGNRLIVELLHDYTSRLVELKPAAGVWAARTLPLPSGRFLTVLGTYEGKLMLREEAPLLPPRIVLADPANGTTHTLYTQAAGFDASGLETELLHTVSSDGATIDYLVTHARGLKLDGSHPTLVYGYGGYDVPVTPRYEPVIGKLWIERGGIYVHAYLRGGGEHGPGWHLGAMRENHVLPLEDMAAILRDLTRRGIATPQHLGILGRSNGGLMTAAVMERVPELMNAAIVGGPLIDMLNFHKLPPGGTWLAEYGDPDVPGDAGILRRYSPMQNIAPASRRYPVPLIITSTDDDRVLPGHARRFAWQLAAKGHDRLYFEDAQGGHYWELSGGPAPGDWRLRATARAVEYTYLWSRLGR